MTVQELIEKLEEFDGDSEVRIAHQPSWPLEFDVGDVVEVEQAGDVEVGPTPATPTVYIAEGRAIGYLPGDAVNELGWGR